MSTSEMSPTIRRAAMRAAAREYEWDNPLPAEHAALRHAHGLLVDERDAAVNLFNQGDFALHSGAQTSFLIDCEALTDEDLAALASYAVTLLTPFCAAVGVPRGGLRFAAALEPYCTPGANDVLVVDDVLTTGASMWEVNKAGDRIGVVIFARGPCPAWVTPLFVLSASSNVGDGRIATLDAA